MFAVGGLQGPLLMPTGVLPIQEVLPQMAFLVFDSPAGMPGAAGGGGVAPGGVGGGVADGYMGKHHAPEPSGVSTTVIPFCISVFLADSHAAAELHAGEFLTG